MASGLFVCLLGFHQLCHLPFTEVAKKGSQKEGNSFLYFGGHMVVVRSCVKSRESSAHPWEQTKGKISWVLLWADREWMALRGGSPWGTGDSECLWREGSRHAARVLKQAPLLTTPCPLPTPNSQPLTSPKDMGRHTDLSAIDILLNKVQAWRK